MDLLAAVVNACRRIIVFLAAKSRTGNRVILHVMTVMAMVVGHEFRLLWREWMDFEMRCVAASNCSLTKDRNVSFGVSVIDARICLSRASFGDYQPLMTDARLQFRDSIFIYSC